MTAELFIINPFLTMSQVQIKTKFLVGISSIGVVVIYVVYSMFSEHGSTEKDVRNENMVTYSSWKTKEFKNIPAQIINRAKSVEIVERLHEFKFGEKEIRIFYLEVAGNKLITSKKKTTVLLLHGMKFSSKDWKKINTLALIASMGYRVVALDLPGFGKSSSAKVDNKASFLAAFIEETQLGRPVILSPSMSGSYALPFLLGDHPQDCDKKVAGYIPVAPALADAYTESIYKMCKVPVMIVYGGKDKGMGITSLKYLIHFANREGFEIKKAGHACYLDKPDEFHKLIYNFLAAVENT